MKKMKKKIYIKNEEKYYKKKKKKRRIPEQKSLNTQPDYRQSIIKIERISFTM